MLKVAHEEAQPSEHAPAAVGGSLLDELVRDGARAMLAALQAEVAAYIDAHTDEVDDDGHRLVVRNGYHQPRQVSTAAGAVRVRQPRLNDKRIDEETGQRRRFASAILPVWARGPFPLWWRVGHIPRVPEQGRNRRWDRHGGHSPRSTKRPR